MTTLSSSTSKTIVQRRIVVAKPGHGHPVVAPRLPRP